ncbi:MAG: isochorismatase family protein [Chloroflexi bacterium]|nr:isochorismatase family protein [Chloroflexota bacterium]
MAIWDQFITERDRQVYERSGHGRRQGFGQRPAALIIDVNYGWVGATPEPILKSIEKYPYSCGLEGWEGVAHIQRLLQVVRGKGLPVFYTTSNETRRRMRPEGTGKQARRESPEFQRRSGQIVEEIAPAEGEVVVYKHAPSAFFGTPLATYLTELQVDGLLVCGTSTSGCVRASVVDANSYGFKVAVIEECTFDRGQASHAINLFDMHMKYADVVPLARVEEYVASLPADLFPGPRRAQEMAPAAALR